MDEPVGIDVSSKKLRIASDHEEFEVGNATKDHQQISKRLRRRGRTVHVCLESTGVYGLDLALVLFWTPGIQVMVVPPRAARHFAEALMRRSKDDPIDAKVLREYARRMEFKPWQPPPEEMLHLRTLARRMSALTDMRTEEKNRLHAAEATQTLACIRNDIVTNIEFLTERITFLKKQAGAHIDRHPRLQCAIARLISVKGIALVSAIRIYAELCVLPAEMTARQWVAHAGLDPRHFESGTFQGMTRISKAGNKYLRAALYWPALTAIRSQPNVKAFYGKLLGNGKKKMVGTVAVMRKLLHSIWGMFKHEANFDGEKFYALTAERG